MTREATAPGRDNLRPVVLVAVAVLAASLALASAWGQDRAGTVSSDEPPSDVLVTYVRQGGISGVDVRLTVTTGGEVTLNSRGAGRRTAWTKQLTDDRFDALRTALERSGFHNLFSDYRRTVICNDCFVDRVTYRGHTVTVQAAAVPPGLAEVLRLLGELVAGE
jgi:hypothetical protein